MSASALRDEPGVARGRCRVGLKQPARRQGAAQVRMNGTHAGARQQSSRQRQLREEGG